VGGVVDVVDADDVDVGGGAAGPWKSTIGSSRVTFSPSPMASDFAVTVYRIPSLSAMYVPSANAWAGTINLAPSLIRTPRYSYLPSDVLHIATRESSVLPKITTVLGASHLAVEST
jgi:hypothetical protein